jgi:hypothetical protein
MLALSIARLFGLAHLICAGADRPKVSGRRTSLLAPVVVRRLADPGPRPPSVPSSDCRMARGRVIVT